MTDETLTAAFKTGTPDGNPSLSARLQAVLDGSFAAIRGEARAFVARPEMAPVPADLPKDEYREVTLQRVRDMVGAGFTRLPYSPDHGGEGRIADSIIMAEIIAHADMSLAVKQGVQFGLFGTSIERLGTARHQILIPDIIAGRLLGGFAMTERSCGSDVQGTQTEAIYDHATRSFTINTPNPRAVKTYIGNAAKHGRMMVVFAQLKMSPEAESEGVHAFLVPIRDESGAPMPGVTIGDNGHKIGLNGVDNGTLAFSNVRVPYENLLDRFGGIDETGAYKSDTPKKTARFFKMIGTLVTGRVFVSMAALSGSKNALAAVVNTIENREVFGKPPLDWMSVQTRLLPYMADAYALHFATRDLLAAFEEGRPGLETMANAIKAVSSDRGMEIVDESRELAGGAGYMSEERYGVLRNDMDVFRTFEGDNTVLRFQVAKSQMGRLDKKFKEATKLERIAKGVVMKTKEGAAQNVGARASRENFIDPDYQISLFAGRERSMMYKLARKFQNLKKSQDVEKAVNICQDDMRAYADAYAERLMIERFTAAVDAQKDREVKALLRDVRDLFAVHTLRRNALWYVEHDHMNPQATYALIRLEHDLNTKIRPYAATLVKAFGIPEQLLSGAKPAPRAEGAPAPKA